MYSAILSLVLPEKAVLSDNNIIQPYICSLSFIIKRGNLLHFYLSCMEGHGAEPFFTLKDTVVAHCKTHCILLLGGGVIITLLSMGSYCILLLLGQKLYSFQGKMYCILLLSGGGSVNAHCPSHHALNSIHFLVQHH